LAIQVIDFNNPDTIATTSRLADRPDRVVGGELIAGTWTSTPGKWHAFTDRDEFCYIISGHVRLIAEDGSAQTFRTGDAFLIPNGFRGFWDVVETTTKHYVIRSYKAD
jgi:hypothetical protein